MEAVQQPDEPKSIHIGQIIEGELRRQERSVTWFSRKLHCDRRNVYDIFTRQFIDTELLLRISIVLGVDFFSYFSTVYKAHRYDYLSPP